MRSLPRWPGILVMFAVLTTSSGCAARWDELFSNERDWSYVTGFKKPDPLAVLHDKTTDAGRRAEALTRMTEPLRHGGNAEKQDVYIKVLTEVATKDPQPLCRLTAIRCLGNYKDPRAVDILEHVFREHQRFTTDDTVMIQKETLVALEKIHSPKSLDFFWNVARAPGPVITAGSKDRFETQDSKLVAIRALGKYKDQKSVDALQHILRTEKDIALRDSALRSLEEATGKRWPGAREAWQADNVQPLPADNNSIQRVTGWFTK